MLKFLKELIGICDEPEPIPIEKRKNVRATVELVTGEKIVRLFEPYGMGGFGIVSSLCRFEIWRDKKTISLGDGRFVPREQVRQFTFVEEDQSF